MRAGLRYVYTGNVHDAEGGTTTCPGCAAPLIVRDWYEIVAYGLTDDGRCADCGTRVPGRFEPFALARQFGRRRLSIAIRERERMPAAARGGR
jgi:pyruvate formate lyase activating enzyme